MIYGHHMVQDRQGCRQCNDCHLLEKIPVLCINTKGILNYITNYNATGGLPLCLNTESWKIVSCRSFSSICPPTVSRPESSFPIVNRCCYFGLNKKHISFLNLFYYVLYMYQVQQHRLFNKVNQLLLSLSLKANHSDSSPRQLVEHILVSACVGW